MFGRNDLTKRVDDLIALMRADTVEGEIAHKSAQDILKAAKGASIQQRDDAVTRLAALIPDIAIRRAGLLAIVCGALVEQGAHMEPFAQPVLARFSEAVRHALPFLEACAVEAAATKSSNENESGDLGVEEAIERFGQQVGERMPDAAQAFASVEWLSTATLAILSRSKALRQQVQADTPLVQAMARFAELGMELPCFHEMLSLLDDEQLIVLHPALARGYVIRIAGIGNNFQLHTLLADALIGDAGQGWLPGERPSPQVAALAKDAPITNPDTLPTAYGAFNLWNWTGLRADGSLPEGQAAGSEHWVWNEGIPADIVPFQGTRVILLGPAPYPRAWNSGRFFPTMVGELEVLRHLSPEEARNWLDRIASASKPVPAGRYISPSDVKDIPF